MQKAENPINPWLAETFRIEQVSRETSDTFTLKIVSEKSKSGFSFLPGQFNMIYHYGTGEVPISISGDPAETGYLLHTIRNVGTVTRRIASLKRGDVLAVRGPYGSEWPIAAAKGRDIVIAAGGIGLAPLRPVIYHILKNREDYQRVFLLFGSRSPEEIIFMNELKSWIASLEIEVYLTVDRASRGWKGHVGVVTTLVGKADFDPANTTAFVCGPEIMMRYMAEALFKQGISEDQLYISMERNMKCGTGFCGHCQVGPHFICKNGPVFSYSAFKNLLTVREL